MARHNDVGRWGEQVARDYMLSRGYAIVDQNARRGKNEVDIIATKDNEIVFVEVKTRTTPMFDPLDAITPGKVRRLSKFAHSYITNMGELRRPQFDIIAIVGTPERYELTHYPDAFLPPLRTY